MVDCQIHTAGVILPSVLHAFETTPRELFVPKALKDIAYHDEDLEVSKGRYLLEPFVHAKMIQALEPAPDDVVLDIGGATGYSAALLSKIVTTVVAVEENEKLLKHSIKEWEELDLQNIVSFHGPLNKGHSEDAPYDLILINGAVENVPQTILHQLAPKGRLVTVIRKPDQGLGDVTLIQNVGENQFSSYTLFQAGCFYLPGFAPAPAFSF